MHQSPNDWREWKPREGHLVLEPTLLFSALRLRLGSCLAEIRRLRKRTPWRVRNPSPEILFRQYGRVKFVRSVLARLRKPDFQLARWHSVYSRDRRCAGARNDPKPGVSTRDNFSEVRVHDAGAKTSNHEGYEGSRKENPGAFFILTSKF